MRSVELFTGAGGLALGCAIAGFKPVKVVERDRWACDTIRENRAHGYPLVADWVVEERDVRRVDWSDIAGPIDLVAGGPPCQPFSTGGKARAADDERDMFPAVTDVIRQLKPRAFMIENVRGLTRAAFANYYQYILLRLGHPELVSRAGETWLDHFQRLQSEHTSASSDLTYKVVPTVVNAADYGVPQQRWRVFMVGFRSDVDADWSFPEPTHSADALLYSKLISGEYWDRHKVGRRERSDVSPRDAKRHVVMQQLGEPGARPWRTVRDAIADLPEPTVHGSKKHLNHVLQPGARSYPGHTGSLIDFPAKALKAGVHGVPGGENMLRRPDGSLRYFTVREAARIQTFPDRYELHGAWSEAMRQLGNAVPIVLAQKVAASVADHLAEAGVREELRRRKLMRASGRRALA